MSSSTGDPTEHYADLAFGKLVALMICSIQESVGGVTFCNLINVIVESPSVILV